MAKQIEANTEKRILEAARRIFTTKGYAASRMDDIAREAGINRALLHYYYRNKDRMFAIIFEEGFKGAFTDLHEILISKRELAEKIKAIVDMYFTTITMNPGLPLFVINELATNPTRLTAVFGKGEAPTEEALKIFTNDVKREVKKGSIKNIDGRQLLINILALTIYPFIARPMLATAMKIEEKTFDRMMRKRKNEITKFIMDAIKPEQAV